MLALSRTVLYKMSRHKFITLWILFSHIASWNWKLWMPCQQHPLLVDQMISCLPVKTVIGGAFVWRLRCPSHHLLLQGPNLQGKWVNELRKVKREWTEHEGTSTIHRRVWLFCYSEASSIHPTTQSIDTKHIKHKMYQRRQKKTAKYI